MVLKIHRLLYKLEDPKMPLLGPNVKWLKLSGLLLPKSQIKKIIYLTLDLIVFLFILTEYIDIWMVRDDIATLLESIKYTMVSSVNVSKVITFIIWQKKWEKMIEFVTEVDLERRQSKDKVTQDIIKKYTKYCRTITYTYWFVTFCAVLLTGLQPLMELIVSIDSGTTNKTKYIEIVHTWMPFNKYTTLGYIVTLMYEVYATVYAGFWMTSFDTNVYCILIFFQYELELLRRESTFLFGAENSPISREEARVRLVRCHKRHNDLMKFSRLFDTFLSPIMFLYVIVCSVMICATAYQINVETSIMQRFITSVFLIFGVTQLFMYCWHSNEVFYVSKDLSLGPYESIWWLRGMSEQKDVSILSYQFNRTLLFSAGPFANVTVGTFISILKGAYSYYTLLSSSPSYETHQDLI